MAFTGYPLDTNRTNLTAAPNRHPQDHNEERAALNYLQGQVDANLASGTAAIAGVQANIAGVQADLDDRVSSGFNAYTPSLANVSLGSGGFINGYWAKSGPFIYTYGGATLSTSGTVSPTGSIVIGLPTGVHTSMQGWRASEGSVYLPGVTGVIPCRTQLQGFDFALLMNSDGGFTWLQDWAYVGNGTSPAAPPWPASSQLHWRLVYRPA